MTQFPVRGCSWSHCHCNVLCHAAPLIIEVFIQVAFDVIKVKTYRSVVGILAVFMTSTLLKT